MVNVARLSPALLSGAIVLVLCGCSASEIEAPDACAVYTAILENSSFLTEARGELLVAETTTVDGTSAELLDARNRASGREPPLEDGEESPCPDEDAEAWRAKVEEVSRAMSELRAEKPTGKLLEEAESKSAEMWKAARIHLPGITDELANSYLEANAVQVALPYLSCTESGGILATVESSRLHEIFRCGWWPEFRRQFPSASGITRFSAPGFSADGRWALLYVSRSWDGLAGEGHLVLLERQAGHWAVAGNLQLWIS